jgi:zinc protease
MAATPVRLPAIVRDELASGLRVWSMPWRSVPVVTVGLLLEGGAAQDPADRHGLASITADLTDEGAAGRGAVQLSEAFARLGTHLDVDVGQDGTMLSFTTLARNLDPALGLLSDVVIRPHLDEADLFRIRDLRVNRLKQLKTSASAIAERAFLQGVFGTHAYGHGTMGTTAALQAISLADARHCHEQLFAADRATLIVSGDVDPGAVAASARSRFADWRVTAGQMPVVAEPQPVTPRCLLVNRAEAPQSELRIGHLGPARQSPFFHALVVLNAALGGQFTSRLNQQLRERKGFTYGARTSFDFRRACSTFNCDTSVQGDATIEAIAEVIDAFGAVRSTRPIQGEELGRAQGSLTRGYVRHFETAAHLVRAAVELVKFGLPEDTFDRFVPAVASVSEQDVLEAAQRFVRPDQCVTVVVGDADRHRAGLRQFGRDVVEILPEF